MRMIDKLPSGSTSKDGVWWENHPTKNDIAEKVDEIIEVLNELVKYCQNCGYKMDGE